MGIDYGDFLTPAARPAEVPNGRVMMGNVLEALAKRRADQQRLEAELAQRNRSDDLQFQTHAAAQSEINRHNPIAEGETFTHDRATEANQAAATEQAKTAMRTRLLSDKDFRADTMSTDPQAMAKWMPAMKIAGMQISDLPSAAPLAQPSAETPPAQSAQPAQSVQPPPAGPDGAPAQDAGPPDAPLPMGGQAAPDSPLPLGSPPAAPQSRLQQIMGPDGKTLMAFNPAANAAAREAAAREGASGFAASGAGTNRYDKAGMALGAKVYAQVLKTTGDEAKAQEAGLRAASQSAGRQVSLTNAQVAGASRGNAAGLTEPYRKNNAIEKFVNDFGHQNGLDKAREGLVNADRMLNMSSTPPSGLKATVEMATLGATLFGKLQSNAEGQRLLAAGGLGTRIENAISKMHNGQFSPEFAKDMADLASVSKNFEQRRIFQLGTKAKRLAAQNGLLSKIPGAPDYVYGRITNAPTGGEVDFSNEHSSGGNKSVRLQGQSADGAGQSLEELLGQP